jgi:L-alanine-DL-glutamate epimerase-like enolase superfamily enzyme
VALKLDSISYKPIIQEFKSPSSFGYKNNVRLFGFCEVIATNGSVGYGEIYAGSYVLPHLVEKIIETICLRNKAKTYNSPMEFYSSNFVPFVSNSGLYNSVIGGVEIAIWDCFLKSENITLKDYLGKNQINKPLIYLSSGSNFMTEAEITKECLEIKNQFQGYKMRIGLNPWAVDFQRINSARLNLPCDFPLMIDSIMGSNIAPWKLGETIERLKLLKPFNFYWIEEPLPPGDLDGLQKICKLFPQKIATGESLTSELEIKSIAMVKKLGFIQLDATHQGGIVKLITFIEALNSLAPRVSMHVWGSQLSFNVNYQISQLFSKVVWVEKPSYKLEIDNYIGTTIETENMIGFSNLTPRIISKYKSNNSSTLEGLYSND